MGWEIAPHSSISSTSYKCTTIQSWYIFTHGSLSPHLLLLTHRPLQSTHLAATSQKKRKKNQLTKTLQKLLLLLLLLLLQFPKLIPKSIPAQVSSPVPSQNQTPLVEGGGGGGGRRAFLHYFPSNLSLHYHNPSHVSHFVQEDVSWLSGDVGYITLLPCPLHNFICPKEDFMLSMMFLSTL